MVFSLVIYENVLTFNLICRFYFYWSQTLDLEAKKTYMEAFSIGLIFYLNFYCRDSSINNREVNSCFQFQSTTAAIKIYNSPSQGLS